MNVQWQGKTDALGARRPDAAQPDGAMGPQNWLALSGLGLIDTWANPFEEIAKGSFMAELRLPLPRAKVLINWQSHQGTARSFGLFVGPDGGLSLLHRNGTHVQRVTMPPPAATSGDRARLMFHFDNAAKAWTMQMDIPAKDATACETSGAGQLGFTLGEMGDIGQRAIVDVAVLWFGFCRSAQMPRNAPWIGLRTWIETARGWVAAGHLRAGDMIITQDCGPIPLRALHRVNMPARGSFAPVLLRGPFFDPRGDVLVSADQRIVMSSGAVEYLFGTDAVLVAARDLIDGQTAIEEDRRAVISAVSLDLGRSALIGGDGTLGMAMEAQAHDSQAPLMCLNSFETAALMKMIGRMGRKHS